MHTAPWTVTWSIIHHYMTPVSKGRMLNGGLCGPGAGGTGVSKVSGKAAISFFAAISTKSCLPILPCQANTHPILYTAHCKQAVLSEFHNDSLVTPFALVPIVPLTYASVASVCWSRIAEMMCCAAKGYWARLMYEIPRLKRARTKLGWRDRAL
jgi:hypothetical protein